MKRILKFGLLATAMVAFVFTGCKDNGDDNGGTRKQKLMSSQTEKYTENGVNHEIKYEYQYDDNKYQIGYVRTETIDGEVTNTQSETKNVKRNSQGLVEEEEQVQMQNGKESFKVIFTYKYNEQSDCTEYGVTQVFGNGTPRTTTTKYEYKYDGQGNMTEKQEFCYDERDELTAKRTYTYDGESATVEVEGRWENYTGVVVYTDSKHNRIKTATYEYKNSDGTTYTTKEENTYDSKGRRTSCVSYRDGQLQTKIESTYDGDGREISYLYRNYTADGKLSNETITEGNTSTSVYKGYNETGEETYSSNSKTIYSDSYREDVLTYESSVTATWGSSITKEEYKDYVVDGNTKTFTKYYYSKTSYPDNTFESDRTSYFTIVYKD